MYFRFNPNAGWRSTCVNYLSAPSWALWQSSISVKYVSALHSEILFETGAIDSRLFMQYAKPKFVPQPNYLTNPGWLDGPGGREKAGLPPGGPACVITDMAAIGSDTETKKMYVKGCFQGVSQEAVRDNMGFAVDTARAQPPPPPTAQEQAILREKCDPQRSILG